MCLLINQTNNKPIEKSLLENADASNPDGIGFAYADGGQVHVEKFRKFEQFYKSYKRAVLTHGKTSNFIVHFRYSTHGTENGIFNVHPFRVNERLVFAHNGMLDVDDHKKKSDTQIFNETILQKLKPNFLNSDAVCSLIEGFIGSDKLVFLNADGKTTIINESRGHWDGGVWFSNSSYKPVERYRSYGWGKDYNYGGTYKKPAKQTPVNTLTYTDKKTDAVKISGSCSWCRSWGDLDKTVYHNNVLYLCNTCKGYSS